MKIFAIYAVVKGEIKSAELNMFRKKYDEPYELHVTLKQPIQIDENEVDEVKQILSKLDTPKSRINIIFNKMSGDEKVLMVDVDENLIIINLQKEILRILHRYDSYVDAETEQYEIDFKPHITVARDVDAQSLSSIKAQLEKILPLKAFIDSITLAVVDHICPKESLNPDNLTVNRF